MQTWDIIKNSHSNEILIHISLNQKDGYKSATSTSIIAVTFIFLKITSTRVRKYMNIKSKRIHILTFSRHILFTWRPLLPFGVLFKLQRVNLLIQNYLTYIFKTLEQRVIYIITSFYFCTNTVGPGLKHRLNWNNVYKKVCFWYWL